jgi:arylsulfatase A
MNSIQHPLICIITVISALWLASETPALANTNSAENSKPNLIIFYADDLGPGMLSCYGQALYKTPNIDTLANEGMLFNNFYGNNVCAPARANLLTGRHDGNIPFHPNKGGLSIQRHNGSISQEDYDTLMRKTHEQRKDLPYIGQMAKDAGYHTAYFGKLGIGYSESHELIKLYGFDHYVGLYDSVVCWGFYPEFYWDNGEKVALPTNPTFQGNYPNCPLIGSEEMVYTEDIWLKEALAYIEAKQDEPFFMIYSTQLPHGPASIAPKDHVFKDRTEWTPKERVFASMIHKMDQSLGNIVAKLNELGLSENTMILFTGDNGHEPSYYIDPMVESNQKNRFWDGHHSVKDVFNGTLDRRGMKRYNFEGGLRVPTIVKWPGMIEAGASSELQAATYDLFATCADIIGNHKDYHSDGISFKNELLGQAQQAHEFLYWKNTTGASCDALLQGKWKLIQEKDTEQSNFSNKQRIYKWALYNIEEDPSETTDLSQHYPEKLQQLIHLIPAKKQ